MTKLNLTAAIKLFGAVLCLKVIIETSYTEKDSGSKRQSDINVEKSQEKNDVEPNKVIPGTCTTTGTSSRAAVPWIDGVLRLTWDETSHYGKGVTIKVTSI